MNAFEWLYGCMVVLMFGFFAPVHFKIKGSPVSIRQAGIKDARDLNRIVNEKKVSDFLSFTPPVPLYSTKRNIAETLKNRNQKWLVMKYGGRIAGSIILRRGSGPSMHTAEFGIAFSGEFQGKGLAAWLLKTAFAYLKKNRVRLLHAQVVAGNRQARKFYEKLGFKECGEIPLFFRRGNKFLPMVFVAKAL